MTIAAGFVCSDGIVIAADTEITATSKFQGRKVWFETRGDTTMILSGAGTAISLGHVRDRLFKHFEPSMSSDDVQTMMHGLLRGFFERYVWNTPEAENPPSFLLGVRAGNQSELYHAVGAPVLARVEQWACIGWGESLGQYIASLLFRPGQSCQWAERLAAYLIHQAKNHTAYCGGATHIVSVLNDGRTIQPEPIDVLHMEKFFDSFHASFGSLLMAGSDDITNEELDRQLRQFRAWVRNWRALTWVNQVEQQRQGTPDARDATKQGDE